MRKVFIFILLLCFCQAADSSEMKVNFVYPEPGGRDPFVPGDISVQALPPAAEEGSVETYVRNHIKLEGIVYDAHNPYAIINDDIYRVGDQIGDVQIIKIEKQIVHVSYRGSVFYVALPEPEEK